MIKDRSDLEKLIEKEIIKLIPYNDKCMKIFSYVNQTYNVPIGLTSDYIAMRVSLSEASEFILFCILDGIEKITEKEKSSIDKYFTDGEIKTYSVSKYEVDTIKFPLRFKMIQINDDQWMGKIDIKNLMKMRAAQIVNYNTNAQRTMQKIIRGDKEFYKITINEATVKAISSLFASETYIPTPFTLNIPQDSNADFYYDDDKCELVIKSLDHFDITDGYHRYIAACKVNDLNPDFNYNMELRIVNFSEEKAKQFIYQEDQKTKMRKIDSDSMNMNKSANIVVTRLNERTDSNLKGMISRNKGTINFGDLAELVNYFYFKGITSKEKEKPIVISATKELINNFNMLTEYNTDYMTKPYSYKQLCAVMCLFNYYKNSPERICNVVDQVVASTEKLDNKKFHNRIPKKSIMNDIESIIRNIEV